jgi:hypothetical protein
MSGIVETSFYDAEKDALVVKTSFDNRAVMQANLEERNLSDTFGRYKGNFVKIGSIHMGDIVRLKNEGFNLLSPDPEEVKRAMLHIQSNEKHLLTVTGTPIAKKRMIWT